MRGEVLENVKYLVKGNLRVFGVSVMKGVDIAGESEKKKLGGVSKRNSEGSSKDPDGSFKKIDLTPEENQVYTGGIRYIKSWYPLPEIINDDILLLVYEYAFDPYKDPW